MVLEEGSVMILEDKDLKGKGMSRATHQCIKRQPPILVANPLGKRNISKLQKESNSVTIKSAP